MIARGLLACRKRPLVVVLDQVRSGYNVGAAFRSSDAFGVEHLYLCGITSKPPHPQIEKSALGATQYVNWSHHPKTLPLLEKLKKAGYQLLAIEQSPKSISLQSFVGYPDRSPYCFIFGHELYGVSKTVLEAADQVIEIPQFGKKKSLNVATCIGIVLWELSKEVVIA